MLLVNTHGEFCWGICYFKCRDNAISSASYIENYGEMRIDDKVCFSCQSKHKKRENMNVYNIAIDADSLIYKACYRHQLHNTKNTPYTEEEVLASFNVELAYFEFCQEIGKIKGAVFNLHTYAQGDTVDALIVFSPKKSFRNDISPAGVMFNDKGKDLGYKANRKSMATVGIKDLKLLVMERLKEWVLLVANVEADDVVNYYAREHNYMVAAIDKDVINANPTFTYNYNTFEWEQGKSVAQIEEWYLEQTLMGDSTDNITGAKGVGKVGAKRIISDLGYPTLKQIEHHFDSELDAYTNHILVRMDQWHGIEKGIINWQQPGL